MFKKKWVRIVVIMLAAALVVATIPALADAFSRTQGTTGAERSFSGGDDASAKLDFGGMKLFVGDFDLCCLNISTVSFRAKVDDSLVPGFIESLRGMKLREVSDAEMAELIESQYFRAYDDMYDIYVYDSNNKLALEFIVLRNSLTGEWHRGIDVVAKDANGEYCIRTFMAADEGFEWNAIELVMDDAFGGDLDKYDEYVGECQANPEMRFDFEGLSENLPGLDYQTYEDMKDQLSDDTPADLPSFIGAEVN